jgi:acetate---CoA ligase (ADP-forming)
MVKKKVKKSVKKGKKAKKSAKKSTKKSAKKSTKKRTTKKSSLASKIPRMEEEKAFDAIKKAKIHIPKQFFCKNEKALLIGLKKLGYPCVLKATSRTLMHKSEINGITTVENEEQATKEFKRLIKLKAVEKVVIQENLSGIELIVGAKRDSNFGNIISVAIGGKYKEVMRDISFRVCPISITDAEQMVNELKGWKLLSGMHINVKLNKKSLYETLVNIGKFSVKSKLNEININPLFCTKENCTATDIKIIEK